MIDKLVSPVHAAATPFYEIDDMISGAIDKIWPFAGLAVFGMFIAGGAMWMLSGGDPQKVSKATNTMLWAFIGACIIALIMLIMGTMEEVLGLPPGTLSNWEI